MENKILQKACDYLLDRIKQDIFPFIDDNFKQKSARKLKSDIYFGLQQFKRNGIDFEIRQKIDSNSIQGKLREQTGLLRIFMNIRTQFYIKKIKIDSNDYVQGYLSVQTKGLCCKWTLASDARARVRASF